MNNRDDSKFKSVQLSQLGASRTALVEAKPMPRREIAEAYRTRSNEISSLLRQTDGLSHKLVAKAVPMIVYAIANADSEIDSKEIASFLDLYRFQTAVQIFRSEILLAFFKFADDKQALAEVSSLKYYENSRLYTDIYGELDAIFGQLYQAISEEERDRLRDDILNLCFIIANSSGGIFDLESNVSDEEKYASSKIKAIIDRNFGHSQGSELIDLPTYLADHIEKFAYLFQSEFRASASLLEIAAFTLSVCEFFMGKYTEAEDRALVFQQIAGELEGRFDLDATSIAKTFELRSPAYIEEMNISFKSMQEGQNVESGNLENTNVDNINDSMAFAMSFHNNATGLDRVDALTCLAVLAPEMLSFAMETAAYVSELALHEKENQHRGS